MKKILARVGLALMFFILMIVLFFVVLMFLPVDEGITDGEIVSSEEMQVITQERDSLLVSLDSLQAVMARSMTIIDSLEQELTYKDANLQVLEANLQERDAEIESLRLVEANAQDMARTFATMTVAELTPIIARLSNDVVLDIFEYTATKRRKFLLTALGDERAAELTNRLVQKEGS